MTRSHRRYLAALALIASQGVAEAAQRAYVASSGSDANTAVLCTLANPCRSFAAAMTVVDSGGEIVALDAAGYGPVTINKSVTITANPGVFAGIAASSGNAVTIATPSVYVVLRNLTINGIGATNGISMTAGTKLTIENCVISNFIGRGIQIAGVSMILRLVDTVVRDNNDAGIKVSGGARATLMRASLLGNYNGLLVVNDAGVGATANMSDSVVTDSGNTAVWADGAHASSEAAVHLARSTIASNFVALIASGIGPARLAVGSSLISGNGYGHYAEGGTRIIHSSGNNTYVGNSTSSGSLTYLPPQ